MKRLAAGAVLAALTLWICLAAPPVARTAALLLFSLLCLAEALPLTLPAESRAAQALGFLLFAIVALGGVLPAGWADVAPFPAAILVGALAIAGPRQASLAGGVLAGALWIGLPTAAILDISAGPDGGRMLLFLVVVVVAGEVGALYGGRRIGGPKLAPGLSPGKTWAGFGCQLALSAAVAPGVGFLLPDGAPGALGLAGIGLVLSGAAALGDLYESRWKRSARRKDSGSLIPGHGGALDRADGLLFAALAFRAILAL